MLCYDFSKQWLCKFLGIREPIKRLGIKRKNLSASETPGHRVNPTI
jgi:hypothetical protein